MVGTDVSAPARRAAKDPEAVEPPVGVCAAAMPVGHTPPEPVSVAKPPPATEAPASARPPIPAEPAEPDPDLSGCKAVPMSYEEIRRHEGRFELWSARTGIAWMVRDPTGPDHESPASRLTGLVERIAAVRGSPIECYGSMDLMSCDEQGRPREIMQADQTVYLNPSRAKLAGERAMVTGRHGYPDVVLEVDHTTDVRGGKLGRYESWGFPELWVEVPERGTPNRPRGLAPGLTIYLLEEGRYRESPESRAFPGWRARSIHDALNETVRSGWTHARLEQVGRRLGEREGTGPDDDPMLRSLRDQSRTEGEAKGRAEGLGEAVREILRSRGIACSESFLAGLPDALAGSAVESHLAIDAALACDGERDFRARIRRR